VNDLGGLYRSADGGATWAADTTGLPYPAVTDITGDGNYLYVNTDGGGVWRLDNAAPPPASTPTPTPLPFSRFLPLILR